MRCDIVVNVDDNAYRIDDFGPLPVVQPQSVADLGELVRRAAAENQALYPIGGRTLLNVGLPPARPGIAVDVRALSQVIDYPARDMTITVQAGITVAQLQALLAAEKQRLPIDVPRADQATLGGVLAVNVSGPRRLGFGTLRDYVIGISTVNDEGQEVKAGGRVVKNVAGYDLCKLHIGALGTLGIISQVTLKLRPLPESKALVTFGCETAVLDRLLDHLHATRTRPVCVDLLNQAAVRAMVARSTHELAGSAVGDCRRLRGQQRGGRLAGPATAGRACPRRHPGTGSTRRRCQRSSVDGPCRIAGKRGACNLQGQSAAARRGRVLPAGGHAR